MISPADWRLKTCLWTAAAITILQLLLSILGSYGIHIPVLNQVAGFIFVTFVPGVLLLRILRIHNINPVESVAYATGLGLFCMMLCGALINFLLPLAGIMQPVTPLPVAVSLSMLNLLLIGIAWLRDRHYQPAATEKLKLDISPALLMLLVLLIIILGVLVLDKTGNNAVLMLGILAIAAVFVLGALRRFIGENIFPAAIYIISLALLYQTTLISPYLTGSDIYFEYQFYQHTALTGIWDFNVPGTINSCLSIVMAVPVYAQMLHLDGVWVFKAVYPLIFSLVPLVMYRFLRIQIGRLPSFLSVFFFISVPVFSLELISLGRQQFAELFFTLLILLLVEGRIGKAPKTAMLIIFAMGVTISHYTLGFINFVYLAALVALVFILRNRLFRTAWDRLTSRTGGLPPQLSGSTDNSLPTATLLIAVIVIFMLSFSWYALVASGSNLEFFTATLVILMQKIGVNIEGLVNNSGVASQYIFAGQGDVLISAALGMDFGQVSWQGKIFRIIQYITQLLIIAGCLRMIIKPSGLKFKREYIAFSFISALMLAGCIVLPWFSNILNITRWYHIALITLSPFLVLGAQSLWELGAWTVYRIRKQAGRLTGGNGSRYLPYLAIIILLPYFVITSGLVFEWSEQKSTNVIDTPYSIALSGHRLDLAGLFNKQDGAAALWLSRNTCDNTTVYTDVHARKIVLFQDYPPHLNIHYFDRKDTGFRDGYVFFTTWNATRDQMAFVNAGRPGMREHLSAENIPGLADALHTGNRVYINGGSEIYQIRAR